MLQLLTPKQQKIFNRNLKRIIKENYNNSMCAFCLETGFVRQSVWNWFNGERKTSITSTERIESILCLKSGELLVDQTK